MTCTPKPISSKAAVLNPTSDSSRRAVEHLSDFGDSVIRSCGFLCHRSPFVIYSNTAKHAKTRKYREDRADVGPRPTRTSAQHRHGCISQRDLVPSCRAAGGSGANRRRIGGQTAGRV